MNKNKLFTPLKKITDKFGNKTRNLLKGSKDLKLILMKISLTGFTPSPVKPRSLERGWRAVLGYFPPKPRALARGAGFTEKSAALITVIMLVLALTILSSVMLSLLANQNRIIEHDIARIKAKYATEATMVRELELARRGQLFDGVHNVSGKHNKETDYWSVYPINGSSIFPNVQELNLSVDYTLF